MPKIKTKNELPDFQQPRKFSMNETVLVTGIGSNIEGYYKGTLVLVRIPIKGIDTAPERRLKQFECLTKSAQLSRLYLVPENEIVRLNEQKQTRQAPKIAKRKTRR